MWISINLVSFTSSFCFQPKSSATLWTDNAVNSDFTLSNVTGAFWSSSHWTSCSIGTLCWSSRTLFVLIFVAPSFPQLLTPPAQYLPGHSSHSLQGWCPHPQQGSVCNPPFFILPINPEVAATGAWVWKNSCMQMIPKSTSLPLISPLTWRLQLLSDDESPFGACRFTLNSTRLKLGPSLVVQWLGVHLVIQGTLVWPLAWEIPHVREQLGPCATATEPVHREPMLLCKRSCWSEASCTKAKRSCRRHC